MKKSGLLDTYSEFFDGDVDKAEKLMDFIDSKKQTETVENLKKSLIPLNSFKARFLVKCLMIKIDSI